MRAFGSSLVSRGAFIRWTAVLLGAVAGCASAMSDKQSGQACTRTDQCATGLACSGGLCTVHRPRPRQNQADAEILDEDAGADGATADTVRK